MEVLTAIVALAFVVVLFVVAWQRRAVAVAAALEPATIDGLPYDAAEVLWSFRQVNESPHLSALAGRSVRSSSQAAAVINSTVESLPPEHALEVIEAQWRLARTKALRLELGRSADQEGVVVPALADAAIIGLVSVVDRGALDSLGGMLLAGKAETALHLPGSLGDAAGAVLGPAGDQAAHMLTGLLDAHIPIITIAMSMLTAAESHRAGLASGRVAENLGWDIGVTGGSIVAGAAIGSLIPVPVVGTAAGALVGAFGGSLASARGKRRHLRRAMCRFRESCDLLAREVDDEHLQQLIEESRRLIRQKSEHLADLASEYSATEARRSWFERTFHPSVGLLIAHRAIEFAEHDLTVDREQHRALSSSLQSTRPTAELRGYAWVAGRAYLSWAELNGPETTPQLELLDAVRDENANVRLARA